MPLPGWDNGNNEAAATLAGAGANLRNYLYQQAVQKPAIQAQTAQTTAQTQALQQNTALQGLQIPSAQQAAIFATRPGYNVAAATAAAAAANRSPQATDISTQGNAPQSSTTPGATAGAMGAGSSGGSPGSMSSPVLPNTQPPNQAGSSTQGASSESGISAPKPGTLAQPKINPALGEIDTDALSPVALTKPSAPVATGSNSGATSTPPPTGLSTPPVSPAASVTAPVKPFDMREHLGDDLMSPEIPQAARDSIMADLRAPFTKAGVPVSDASLVSYYRDSQSAYYPTMAQRIGSGGMVPIKATLTGPGGSSAEFVNPSAGAQVEAASGGEVSGSQGSNQMYLGPDGLWHESKNFTTADKLQATQATIAESANALQLGNEAMQAIKDNPRLVGPIGGQELGHLTRDAEAVAGFPQNLTGESTLNQFQSKEFLETLSTLHVGRVTDKEYQAVMATMPRRDEPAQAWMNWNTKHFQPLMETINASLQQELKTQQGGARQTLPSVGVSAPVGAPGQPTTAGAPAQNDVAPGIYPTMESRAHLPSGTKFQAAPDQWRRKN